MPRRHPSHAAFLRWLAAREARHPWLTSVVVAGILLLGVALLIYGVYVLMA